MRPVTRPSPRPNKHNAGPERNGRADQQHRPTKTSHSSLAGPHRPSRPSSKPRKRRCLPQAVTGVPSRAMLRTEARGQEQLSAVALRKKRGTVRWLVHSMVVER